MKFNIFICIFLLICPIFIIYLKNNIKIRQKKRSEKKPEVILFGLPWCRQTDLQKKILSVEHLNAIKIKDMRNTTIIFEESPSWLYGDKILKGIKTKKEVNKMLNHHKLN